MKRLYLVPDNSAYTMADGVGTLMVKLDGGKSRFRRDMINPARTLTLTFICDTEDYDYLRAFYRWTEEAGELFNLYLIVDRPTLTNHVAKFIPGSMQLTGQRGLTYNVSVQIEAMPVALPTHDADEDIMDAYEAAHG